MEEEPVWISQQLQRVFEDTIVNVYERPQLYHPELVPAPWRLSVFGREGVHKFKAFTKLLIQHKYTFDSVDVKLGHTTAALQYMECALKEASKETRRPDGGPNMFFIINHADILCYEPDNDASAMASLTLSRFAEQGIFLIALFDRIPGDQDPQKITVWAKEFQMQFFRQFQHIGYGACPTSDFRQEYFRYSIRKFVGHMIGQQRIITLDLSEGDYIKLADYSTFATIKNIVDFLRNVYNDVIRDKSIEVFDLNLLCARMSLKLGVEHVCDYDSRAVEDNYSLACGKGPIVQHKTFQPPPTPVEAIAKTHITSFGPETADVGDAKKALKKKKRLRK